MALLVFAVAAILVSVPGPATAAPSARSVPAAAPAGLSADVTWNGADLSTLGTISSALAIDFSQSANLKYSWSNAPSPGINDARLQMFYFGFAVATRDVTLSVAQTTDQNLPLNWTPLSIGYVLEGVYRLTASIIAPNGTTMWSENFYVRGNAPLGFVAVIPIVLILIVIYEVYALVRSGRYAALGRKPSGPPPSAPPAAKTAEPTPAPEEAPPASEDAPPSTGGTS